MIIIAWVLKFAWLVIVFFIKVSGKVLKWTLMNAWRYKKFIAIALVLLISQALIRVGYTWLVYPNRYANDVKHLSEALYFETRDEPLIGKIGIANVIFKRVRSSQFPNSIELVIRARERVRSCDFSYRCDGRPDNPLLQNEKYHDQWRRIQHLSKWLLIYQYTYINVTGGALYYRNPRTATSGWFQRQIDSWRFIKTWSIGNHDFYWARY